MMCCVWSATGMCMDCTFATTFVMAMLLRINSSTPGDESLPLSRLQQYTQACGGGGRGLCVGECACVCVWVRLAAIKWMGCRAVEPEGAAKNDIKGVVAVKRRHINHAVL